MLPASLHTRVLLSTSAIGVAAILAITLLSARAAQRGVDEQFDADAQAAQAIAGAVLQGVPVTDPGGEGGGFVSVSPAQDFTLATPTLMSEPTHDGERAAFTQANPITADELRSRLAAPPFVWGSSIVVHEIVAGETGAVIGGVGGGVAPGAVPWELAVDDSGMVYIGLDDRLASSLTDDGSTLLDQVNRNLLVTALAAIGMTVSASYVASRTVTRPLQALTGAARELERGDRGQRVEAGGSGEVGELAEAFNSMADSIERQEELRRALVSDVAHELSTPIHNFVGQLDAVDDGLMELDQATLNSMRNDALLLARLVKDLNELAQAEAGQLTLHQEQLDVVGLLDGVVRSAGPRAEAAGVTLELEASVPTVTVTADRERMAQVAHNLIDNAITNTPRGGAVTVRIVATPVGATFEVHDTGRGIAPEHLPHIFDRFYRADSSRSRATGGAGLGLAIVQRLVRAHDGQVEVDSAPGEGSRFVVQLPRN